MMLNTEREQTHMVRESLVSPGLDKQTDTLSVTFSGRANQRRAIILHLGYSKYGNHPRSRS